jgi:hypothetical protein
MAARQLRDCDRAVPLTSHQGPGEGGEAGRSRQVVEDECLNEPCHGFGIARSLPKERNDI